MENNLKTIKEELKDCFDVKYRDVATKIGKATVVFTDELCSTSIMSEYIIC